MRIHITGGRLIDPASHIDEPRDLVIEDGKILALERSGASVTADQTIDAGGLLVCPGLVELRARLREPGEEYKATMESELGAAVSAGITTLSCPPDTTPVIDTPAMSQLIQQKSRQLGLAKVLPTAALTRNLAGEALTDMAALAESGCAGISNALNPITNSLIMRRAMQYASTFELTVFLHSQDPWLLGNGCVHEGLVSTQLGLPAIPEAAETVGVARDLALVEHTGVRAHFCHLSSARAVEMVASSQQRGFAVTADVTSHHLHLSEDAIGYFNSACHVLPPLRTENDRHCLREALGSGTVNAICSDHQPHEADAKRVPFSESAPGISGLETLLPMTLELVEDSTLSLSRAIALLTVQPASILGIDAGTLRPGKAADICLIDLKKRWRLNESGMRSRGKNTPFLDKTLTGKVVYTLVDGHVVYQQPIS